MAPEGGASVTGVPCTASASSASVMTRSSAMARSTRSRRRCARSGLRRGLYALGACGSPASVAASTGVSCAAGLPK
jgi:hypothetical protein